MPKVTTCLLIDEQDNLLILKRSDKVSTYRSQWGGIAGYIEEDEAPLETALKEIQEEAGLLENDIELIKQVDPVQITDYYDGKRYDWEIFVFIFKTEKKDKIKIDWEHSEYKWIPPSEIAKYDTVPHLREIVKKLFL